MVKNKATARLCHISWPGLSLFLICPTPFILRVPLDPARSLKKIPRPRPPVGTQTKRTPRLPLAKGKVLERPSALASKLHTSSAYNPAAAAAASRQSCLTVQPHRRQPTRLCHPWDSPGKNTGVGCHFLLHCMKVKSESEVAQPCPTICDPMDCNLPGSSIHGTFQARVLEWGAIAFSGL